MTAPVRYTDKVPRTRHGVQMPPPPLAVQPTAGLTTKPVELFDRYVGHPGTGLEPERVIQIYRAAEGGYPIEQCDLFEDVVENDGHLRSLITARTLAVTGKKWQIQAGGEATIDTVAAEILETALRDTNFDELVGHVLSSRYYGWAGAEIDWREKDGDWLPAWFVCVPQRRFVFDALGQPLLLNDASYTGTALSPGRWVWTRNPGTTLTARAGLMRTACWYALFKKWSWRDLVVYAEKFGVPMVVGKYKPEATEEDKEELQETVENIGEDGQAMMSTEAEVDIREAQRGGDSNGLHRAVIEEANAELSKLITGSTLTVETGGPGSFALGKVHESRSFDLVLADMLLVVNRFREGIARPFLVLNGLEAAKTPELVVHVTRETDPLTRAKLAETLWQMGLPLDTEQLREDHQMRAPPSPERTLPPPPDLMLPAAGARTPAPEEGEE